MNLFGHRIRPATMLVGLIEFAVLATVLFFLHRTLFIATAGHSDTGTFIKAVIIPSVLLMTVMFSLGLYEARTRHTLKTFATRMVATAILAGTLTYVHYHISGIYPRNLHLIAPMAAIAEFAVILGVWWAFLQLSRTGTLKRRLLILGAGERADEISQIARNPGSNLIVQRRIPDDAILRVDDQIQPLDLLKTCLDEQITEIVVAMRERRGMLPTAELVGCRMHGIQVSDYSSFRERESGLVDLDNLYPSWLVFSGGFQVTPQILMAKRLFDIATSLLMLTLVLPLMVVTYLAVRYDTPGPGFYRQTRVGKDGRTFDILKFRSMRTDAEAGGKARWADKNDSRITRFGHFIRRSRIDELPQLINVLMGDMSFVGPRPERPEFVAELARHIPYYEERHRVKPGITGWAQINYPYGASVEDAKEKLKYDLYYMKNCSLFLDGIIIMKTIKVVMWPDGVR